MITNTNTNTNTNKTPSPIAVLLAGMLASAAAKAQADCNCPNCTARRARESTLTAMDERDAAAAAESAAAAYAPEAAAPEPAAPLIAPPAQHAYNLAACIANLGLEGAELLTEFNGKRYSVAVHVDYSADQ